MLVCDVFGTITFFIVVVTVKITSILWHPYRVIICRTVFGFESRVSTIVRCLGLVYNRSYGSLVQVKEMVHEMDCRLSLSPFRPRRRRKDGLPVMNFSE